MTKPKRSNECCNPFSMHKIVRKKLRFISPALLTQARQQRITLNVNNLICNKCRLKIEKPSAASSSESQGCRKSDESEQENDESEEEMQMEISQTKRDRVCCNPFSIHGDNVKKNVREITQELIMKAGKLNVIIEIGQFICNQCRGHITRSVESLEVQETVEFMGTEQQPENLSTDTTPE